MGPKVADNRFDAMEKELEELKAEMQRLPVMECSMEQLTQGLSKVIQAMDEMQRSIAVLMAATLHSR